jgi:hypothetical protein
MNDTIQQLVNDIETNGTMTYNIVMPNMTNTKGYMHEDTAYLIGYDMDGNIALVRNSSEGENIFVRSDVVLP